MKSRSVFVGIDVGGTRLKGGAIDAAGRVLARTREPTAPGQSHAAFESQLDLVVGRLLRTARCATPAALGVALTGPVDPDRGCVYLPGKIPGLDRHRTVPYLRQRWGVPVLADNDGRLACYAEWRAGAGRGVANLLVFTLGTGIGSGVVLDGRLLRDRHFLRGTQCGHFVIDVHGPRCLTGANGTGESVASITALVHEVRGAMARGLPVRLGPGEVDFRRVAAAVRAGDALVTEIFGRWLDRFATVLLNGFYAYTPDLILLAGGPTRAADLFLRPLARRLNAAAFRVPPGRKIPVRLARLGEDAGWHGAALLACDTHADEPIHPATPGSSARITLHSPPIP